VLASRPYIVAIITNVARGYATLGQMDKALQYVARAEKIQPHAPAVRSVQVLLYGRAGQEAKALQIARQAVEEKVYDYDLLNASFALAARAGDYQLAADSMRMRMLGWPDTRVQGYVQLGNMYATLAKDRGKALDAFRRAVLITPDAQKGALLPHIPADYRAPLGLPPATASPGAADQTSASKG